MRERAAQLRQGLGEGCFYVKYDKQCAEDGWKRKAPLEQKRGVRARRARDGWILPESRWLLDQHTGTAIHHRTSVHYLVSLGVKGGKKQRHVIYETTEEGGGTEEEKVTHVSEWLKFVRNTSQPTKANSPFSNGRFRKMFYLNKNSQSCTDILQHGQLVKYPICKSALYLHTEGGAWGGGDDLADSTVTSK